MSVGFPYAERAARAREASKVLGQAALARKRVAGVGWDRADPSFSKWEHSVEAFWAAIRDALPAEFWESAEQVQRGDPAGVEWLIEFLQADPYYFRSGYLKADVLRWLGRVPLDEPQMDRLRAVVLKAVTGDWRREFRRYCTFAKRLDSPAFRRDLDTLSASKNGDVSNRAKRVLNALDGVPSIWHEWQAQQRMSAEEQAAALARLNAKTIQSVLEHVRRHRHQMDLREVRAQLEFIVRMGSVEAEELLQELEPTTSGDTTT